MVNETADELHSIGDVAEATGISVDTIRVWERRYGRPEPVRLPSGHRRYTDDHIRWLRRVAEALARGHRPGKVVSLPEADLDRLLAAAPKKSPDEKRARRLLRHVSNLDSVRLRRALESEAESLGPRDFVLRCAAPIVTAVGRAWADGEIDIRHEHLFSEALEDILRRVRASLTESAKGPVVLLATLAGEKHGLGLQMAAVLAKLAGARARVVGTDTPNEELVAAAAEIGAHGIAISVSLATGGVATDRVLADLRKRLPRKLSLLVGGRGARGVRRGPRGVHYAPDFDGLEDWVRSL